MGTYRDQLDCFLSDHAALLLDERSPANRVALETFNYLLGRLAEEESAEAAAAERQRSDALLANRPPDTTDTEE